MVWIFHSKPMGLKNDNGINLDFIGMKTKLLKNNKYLNYFCTPYYNFYVEGRTSFVPFICIFPMAMYFELVLRVKGKIQKVPRGIQGEKSSKDMASSRNLVSTIGALASPEMGDGTRCPEG